MVSVIKISEYLPVILIFILVVYTKSFIEIANTPLGRFIAILLILLYTYIDVIQGLFVCLLIILFYQMEFNDNLFYAFAKTEYMSPISNENPIRKLVHQFKTDQDENIVPLNLKVDSKYNTEGDYVLEPKENLHKTLLISSEVLSTINNEMVTEPFSKLTENELIESEYAPIADNTKIFQNQHCTNSKLMYKDFPVKKEMSQHMFKEVEFKNDAICNLCDPNCEFAVNKINTEQKLVRESFVSIK
jgi:hypothetical protein